MRYRQCAVGWVMGILDGYCQHWGDFRRDFSMAKLTNIDQHYIMVFHQHKDHLNIPLRTLMVIINVPVGLSSCRSSTDVTLADFRAACWWWRLRKIASFFPSEKVHMSHLAHTHTLLPSGGVHPHASLGSLAMSHWLCVGGVGWASPVPSWLIHSAVIPSRGGRLDSSRQIPSCAYGQSSVRSVCFGHGWSRSASWPRVNFRGGLYISVHGSFDNKTCNMLF